MENTDTSWDNNIGKKLDILLRRTMVIEEGYKATVKEVEEHDVILRGVNKDDGIITDIYGIKENLKSLTTILKAVMIPLIITLTVSIAGFIWGLITHTLIILTP